MVPFCFSHRINFLLWKEMMTMILVIIMALLIYTVLHCAFREMILNIKKEEKCYVEFQEKRGVE